MIKCPNYVWSNVQPLECSGMSQMKDICTYSWFYMVWNIPKRSYLYTATIIALNEVLSSQDFPNGGTKFSKVVSFCVKHWPSLKEELLHHSLWLIAINIVWSIASFLPFSPSPTLTYIIAHLVRLRSKQGCEVHIILRVLYRLLIESDLKK